VIISPILVTFICYNALMWWGEIWCWSLLGLKRLNVILLNCQGNHTFPFWKSLHMHANWMRNYRSYYSHDCRSNSGLELEKRSLFLYTCTRFFFVLFLFLTNARIFLEGHIKYQPYNYNYNYNYILTWLLAMSSANQTVIFPSNPHSWSQFGYLGQHIIATYFHFLAKWTTTM